MKKIEQKLEELTDGLEEVLGSWKMDADYLARVPDWLGHIRDCLVDLKKELDQQGEKEGAHEQQIPE